MDKDLSVAAVNLSLDAIVMMDEDGRVSGWNPAAEELLGWSRDEAVGQLASDLLVPSVYRESHEEGLRRFRASGEGPVLGKVLDHLEARHRDGRHFPIELRISKAGVQGEKAIFVAFLRDISDRKREHRLQAARHAITRIISNAVTWNGALEDLLETLSTTLELALAEVWLVDGEARRLNWGGGWHLPDADLSGFIEVSKERSLRRGVGLPGRVWADARPVGILNVHEDPNFPRAAAARSHGLRSALAFPLTHDDRVVGVIALFGRLDEIDGPLLDALGDIGQQLGQFIQRTQIEAALKEAQDQVRASLEFQAFHDPLTALPNRSLFDDRLPEALAVPERERRSQAVMLLDIDGFKEINDQFGHHSGDTVLKEVAARLRQALRRVDTVARLGGDEFGIIPQGGMDDAGLKQLAEKIADAFKSPIDLESGVLTISLSIGGALYPRDGREPAQLVRCSDAAMYHAKALGLGWSVYAKEMVEGLGRADEPKSGRHKRRSGNPARRTGRSRGSR